MTTFNDKLFFSSMNFRDKYEKRATIRKDDLAKLLTDKLNAQHYNASMFNPNNDRDDYGGGVRSEIEAVIHDIASYRGYNNRIWHTFTDLDGWYEVIKGLQAADNIGCGPSHYGKFIYGMSRTNRTRFYYGGSMKFVPTMAELERAQLYLSRYQKALGLV